MNNPVLSICIPTYNRAQYLRSTLENITSDPDFDERVEIVISDNASTDNTQEVGLEFANKYHNVKYYRNEENVIDFNFKLALTRAQGKYLKLSNDTVHFKKGAIKFMLDKIISCKDSIPLYFYLPTPASSATTEIQVADIDSFMKFCMFYVGWIGNFGLWKKDIDCLDVDSSFYKLKFVQVSWICEMLKKYNCANIFFGEFYYVDQPRIKGGYNFFHVQITNLFRILRYYGLSNKEYIRQKKLQLKYFTLACIKELLFLGKETEFDLKGTWMVLIKEYWYIPGFYTGLIRTYIKIKCPIIISVIKRCRRK